MSEQKLIVPPNPKSGRAKPVDCLKEDRKTQQKEHNPLKILKRAMIYEITDATAGSCKLQERAPDHSIRQLFAELYHSATIGFSRQQISSLLPSGLQRKSHSIRGCNRRRLPGLPNFFRPISLTSFAIRSTPSRVSAQNEIGCR